MPQCCGSLKTAKPVVKMAQLMAGNIAKIQDLILVHAQSLWCKADWRVAPVSGFYSKRDEGAPGPSPLGTGDAGSPGIHGQAARKPGSPSKSLRFAVNSA